MLTVMFSVDLPVMSGNRQDRDIAAQHAQLERVRAQREDARRSYETAVRGAQVDWETWNRRVQRYETVLIPLAQERVKAATAAYRGGRSDLAAVIEARSCERFGLLAEALADVDAELARFYASLLASEARHHGEYVRLAESCYAPEVVRERLAEIAAHEAAVLAEGPFQPRLHG